MAEYQARFYTRTGDPGPTFPVQPRSVERGLNGVGEAILPISLDYEGLAEEHILPWANEVLLLRREDADTDWEDADVAHDGPILEPALVDAIQGQCTLTVGTVADWFGRRNQRPSVAIAYGTPTDIDEIANAFVYLSQHPEPPFAYSAVADYRAGQASNPTGVTRLFQLAATAAVNWREKLNELAGGSPGFDWDFETTWSGGVRTRVWRSFYPGRGSVITKPTLERGRGLVDLTLTMDGARAANWVKAFGNNGTTLASTPQQDSTSQTDYGLLEFLDTASDINNLARLNDRAAEQLRLRKPPTRLIEAGYEVSARHPFRWATIGDTITVKAARGPLQLDAPFRIVREKIMPTPGGLERVSLTFQDPLS